MEELLEILNELKPGVNFEVESNLVKDGILDSLAIIRLVGKIEDEFDVSVAVTDLIPENFNSVHDIMALIERLEDED